ncbi:aldose epimerase family protein [Xanthovirga aplysinae]|uniref:aldose epimerase family protein n=1 Tax=Xanthovirga aplysinae TaxID=2529853 RepID=UPI0012BD5C2A|nr:aldose epimerase family protein [Xanthovirga aplysinae]MTI31250.1 galactose mutarotase [Xanthovirga aplysinae]
MPNFQPQSFGKLQDGRETLLYTLSNKQGMEVKISNYGGVIVSIKVKAKNGDFKDVVLGYDSVSGYEKDNYFIGTLVGRFANRIAKGKFTLNGKSYTLAQNNGENHLHGGPGGFHRALWETEAFQSDEGKGLKLSYFSKDGEEGYPGNLKIAVSYFLAEDNSLSVTYWATSDQPTVINFTQHSYFNLSGDPQNKILNHQLMINADSFLPTDSTAIPTGERRNVKGTSFDFLNPQTVGSRIEHDDEQLKIGSGYDHCWVLNKEGNELSLAATLCEPESGCFMEVFTTEPGVQFYAGNFLDDAMIGKKGQVCGKRSALCLETQHFPDSPNRPDFPSVVLNPEKEFKSTTIFKFSTQ